MRNIYQTVSEKQMRRLVQVVGRYRFSGCLHGDANRYARTNGRLDVLFYWVDVEPLPRTVAIKPVTLSSIPSRFYTLKEDKSEATNS